jgi:type IV pilus assembly protein PilF
MPLRRVLALCVLTALVASGCSRLTFVKPNAKRQGPQESPRSYSVSDSPAVRQRLATQDLLNRATQRLHSGDLQAAEADASGALKTNPDSADAHTLLAVIHDRRGNARQAGTHYQRASELAPRQGAALNNYGAWLCQNGNPAESLVWFDRAIAAPGYATPASALANAGGCAMRSGQYERAERDLRQALQLDPGNAYALASMAENEFRQQRYFEARAFNERRLAAAPATADVLQLAARIEEKLGDRGAAGRYHQRLRAEFPDRASADSGETQQP